jgi:hypothetical protein
MTDQSSNTRRTIQRQEGEADSLAPQSDDAGRLVEGVDVEALAERVYQKLLDDLRLEQERGGWRS